MDPNILFILAGLPDNTPIDFRLYAWGANAGQLGLGDTTQRLTPTQVGSDVVWKNATCGNSHSLATKRDGTLWSCGQNGFGQLGLNDTTQRLSFVQVGSEANWAVVSAGFSQNSCAVKNNGTLWSWGRNDTFGQLGLGDNTNRPSPTQVGTDTNWQSVSCGQTHVVALKTNGTLWAWGEGTFGALGDGTTVTKNYPVQVGSDTNWAYVACGRLISFALKTDGTLWAWGVNDGRLGLGADTANKLSPVQVGTGSNWTMTAASNSSGFALRNDGTLWGWGVNSDGCLGLGDTTNRTTPTQIGTDTNWASIYISNGDGVATAATKADGSIYSWGRNNVGQLGLGDTTRRLSPTRIGTANNWLKVVMGSSHALAITQ
jgi:alpha-tubulin suppressor-like RCC1 family protein